MYDDPDTDALTFWLQLTERGWTAWFFMFMNNMERFERAFHF